MLSQSLLPARQCCYWIVRASLQARGFDDNSSRRVVQTLLPFIQRYRGSGETCMSTPRDAWQPALEFEQVPSRAYHAAAACDPSQLWYICFGSDWVASGTAGPTGSSNGRDSKPFWSLHVKSVHVKACLLLRCSQGRSRIREQTAFTTSGGE